MLNFANRGQGDAAWDWLGKGLADLTIGDLASQDLKVVSREQMQAMLHELELKKAQADPEAVSRVLKVTRCVYGSYLVTGTGVEINAVLIDASTGEQLHLATYQGTAAKVLDVEKKVAAELADVLSGSQPGTIDPKALPQWTESLPASQLLYEGVDLFDHGEYFDAWSKFRRALKQDDEYADALYWSARMMYYLDEYHHARLDLEKFARNFAEHPRVGDAVMEIINCAQLTASSAEDVLRVLRMAMDLAPEAEVPNQFGVGLSSNVAVYAAGLAAQIYIAEQKYDLAFEQIAKALKHVPREEMVYKLTYPEALYLAVKHAEKTGVVLKLPPKPDPTLTQREQIQEENRGVNLFDGPLIESAGKQLVNDELVALEREGKEVHADFGEKPWLQPKRYFCAPAGFRLLSIDLTFAGHVSPDAFKGTFSKDLARSHGKTSIHLTPLPGQRCLAVQVSNIYSLPPFTAKANLAADNVPLGTLTIKPPRAFAVNLTYDGLALPRLTDTLRLTHVLDGKHTLEFRPHVLGPSHPRSAQVRVAAGKEVVVEVLGQADPIRRDEDASGRYYPRTISSPYDYFRMGADMGDHPGLLSGEVQCFRDRNDRLVAMWTMRRDLYMVTSSDGGYTWTKTQKLPPPVNTAHDERVPVLLHDRSGRYVLAFVSDRNLEHAPCTYVCWSTDLKTFSAPYRLSSRTSMPIAVLESPANGHIVYMFVPKNRLRTLDSEPSGYSERAGFWMAAASDDLARWSEPKEVFERRMIDYRSFLPPRAAATVKDPILHQYRPACAGLIERDGRITALTIYPGGSMGREVSADGINFEAIAPLPKLPAPTDPMVLAYSGGRLYQFATRLSTGRLVEIDEQNPPKIIAAFGYPYSAAMAGQMLIGGFVKRTNDVLAVGLPGIRHSSQFKWDRPWDEPWFTGDPPLMGLELGEKSTIPMTKMDASPIELDLKITPLDAWENAPGLPWLTIMIAALCTAMAALAGAWFWLRLRRRSGPYGASGFKSALLALLVVLGSQCVTAAAGQKATVAVVAPLHVATGREEDAQLGDFMADALSIALADHENVTVVERERLSELLKEQKLALKGLADPATAARVGQLLSADMVVAGSILDREKRLHFTVNVLRVQGQAVLGNVQVEAKRDEVDRSMVTVAERVAKIAGAKLASTDPAQFDDSPEGRLHLMRGIGFYYANNPDQAIVYCLRAVRIDPRLQEARLWIARSYLRLKEYDHVRAELQWVLDHQPSERIAKQAQRLLKESEAGRDARN